MKSARALALLALGTALLVPISSATATEAVTRPNRATTTDARGDVTYVRILDGDVVQPGGPAPTRTMGDIRTVQIKHASTTVRVLIKYVQLNRVGRDHLHVTQIRTPRRTYEVDLYATTGAWRGKPMMYTTAGTAPKCALSWKIDYDLNTALIVIPRKCLGYPTWIQGGGGMSNSYGQKRFADDGLTARPASGALVLGPRLYH